VVNFLDPSKLPVAKTAVLRAAAGLNAKLAFLNDGHQPQVICYSEDFYAGRTDLEYLNEKMLQEERPPLKFGEHPADTEEPMSDELLQALKGGR
jgi:hypothetical protein